MEIKFALRIEYLRLLSTRVGDDKGLSFHNSLAVSTPGWYSFYSTPSFNDPEYIFPRLRSHLIDAIQVNKSNNPAGNYRRNMEKLLQDICCLQSGYCTQGLGTNIDIRSEKK